MLAELILGLKRHSGRRPECCPQVEILPAAAAERARPNDVRRRTQWCKCRRRIDPARRVFIDETWKQDQYVSTARMGAARAADQG
jgi:hypothetical protein